MKKIVIITVLLLNICLPIFADDIDEILEDEEQIKQDIIETSATVEKTPQISSRAAIIYDRTSKRIIWGKEENQKRAMASTTKIMTAIVVLENANLTDTVQISKKAAGTGGSRLGLKTNDKITVNDLLYGLMLRSGNDAAIALAEHVGEDVSGFASLMNNKANELGLKSTNFVTPHGLDATEHYTTAYELAVLTDYALNNKKFAQIVNTKTTTININGYNKTLANTNELLGNFNGVDGVKTGFTNNAGRCLVTSTTRNNHQIICVVLGADTKKIRTKDSAKLIEYAFSNYEYIDAKEMVEEEFKNWCQNNTMQINKAVNIQPELAIEEIKISEIPINKNTKKDLEVEITAQKYLQAPVNANQIIGKVELKIENETILSSNILIKNQINKKNIFTYLTQLLIGYGKYMQENFVR